MKKEYVKRFSVSVPPKLLRDFDEFIKSMGYKRSRAIQLAMQNFLSEYAVKHGKEVVVGAILMLYDHKRVKDTLTDIQHEYTNVIKSTIHIHLDERNCFEVVAVIGEAEVIQNLARKLMKEKGVKQLKLTVFPLP